MKWPAHLAIDMKIGPLTAPGGSDAVFGCSRICAP